MQRVNVDLNYIPFRWIDEKYNVNMYVGLQGKCDVEYEDTTNSMISKENVQGIVQMCILNAFTELSNNHVSIDDIINKNNDLVIPTILKRLNDEGKNMGLVFSNPLFFSNLTENDKVMVKKYKMLIEYQKSQESLDWTCPNCGAKNTGNYCEYCGTKKP